jgi:hypothetical protein
MANIMVNETCNLRCPYCFASEFVNQDRKEMTLDAFKEALKFILGKNYRVQVGIIGGEPTLYSHINEALEIAMADLHTYPVSLYTNAVHLDKIRPELLECTKFRMLVNCNSPEDMGATLYEKMRKNIRAFVDDHIGEGRFKLSFNLYKPDFDYRYAIDLVKEFQCDTIRMSISVPSRNNLKCGDDALTHFRKMKPIVLEFTAELCALGVIPGFDCNFMPQCVLTEDEKRKLSNIKNFFIERMDRDQHFWQRSIISGIQSCSPVVDILPDLTSVRCFGLSEYTKVNIQDFKNIEELEKYYTDTIDKVSRAFYFSEECKECFMRKNGKCTAGCLTYKMEQLLKYREGAGGAVVPKNSTIC